MSRQQRRALAFREERRRRRQARSGGLIPRSALAVGAVLAGAGPAAAGTFTVVNANDAGAGSLRAAIVDAVAAADADQIVFDTAGVFATPQTISLLSALPQITAAGGPLTIQGPGAARLTIRRDPGVANFRLFDHAGGAGAPLAIAGVTLTGGTVAGDGGAIRLGNDGVLTVTGSVLTGNTATGSNDGGAISLGSGAGLILQGSLVSGNAAGKHGGGIYLYDDNALTVEHSMISGNLASGNGGAIYAFAGGPPLVIQHSVISGNSAVLGGGVYLYAEVDLVVRHSTISGNVATGEGGGVYGYGSTDLTIENATLSNNTAGISGGGVFWIGSGGTLAVRNATVTGNTANGANPEEGGGGIFQAGISTLAVANSVVSGNTNGNGPDVLSDGPVTLDFSAVGSGTGFTFSGANNLAFGTDPMLGPLQDNGGLSPTHLPLAGSPLINAGSNALAPPSSFDQRGPGYPRIFDTTVDIGAVEVTPPGYDFIFADGFE